MKQPNVSPDDFVTVWNILTYDEDALIRIRRSDEFYSTALTVSDYIKDLPLSKEQNDHLVGLMIKHTNAAELSGFKEGIRYGVFFGQHADELTAE